jgi:hypothetical protein
LEGNEVVKYSYGKDEEDEREPSQQCRVPKFGNPPLNFSYFVNMERLALPFSLVISSLDFLPIRFDPF